jgi:2-polyprenyl-3-methyl-5-hydroxy-6-metoxy-1,4-benzoquinol methylase
MKMSTNDKAGATDQTEEYYHHIRREIAPLLPPSASQVLEVGAGAGSTLKWMKSVYPGVKTTAVELNSELRIQLERNADVVLIGPVDEALPRLKTYDLILLLDVLEHLPDSTKTLQALVKHLAPGGQVIVSLPNVAHLSVSVPLLLGRRFTYQESGILDKTHVRFFVEDTAVKLLNDAGLVVTTGLISGLQGPKSRLVNLLSFGLLRHHFAKQYIMCGKPTDGSAGQGKIRWGIAS